MKKDVTVIGATAADLPELMELFRLLHKENGIFEMNDDCTRDVLMKALQPRPEGVIGIIRERDKIVAAIMLMITRLWYTQQFHLEELLNYVHPDHRGSNYADALIRFAKHSAEQLGIPLFIGILTNSRLQEKIRLYRRRLGVPMGVFFIHNAPWFTSSAPSDDNIWRVRRVWKVHRGRAVVDLPDAQGTTMIAPAIISN